MKKIFVLAVVGLAFVSCKKYNCDCDIYDPNTGSYSTETHTVKARTSVQAEIDCIQFETSYSDCTIY